MNQLQEVLSNVLQERQCVISIETKPDHLNRQQFFAHWRASNIGYSGKEIGNRGQVFFTTVSTHIQTWKEKGFKVFVFENNKLTKTV